MVANTLVTRVAPPLSVAMILALHLLGCDPNSPGERAAQAEIERLPFDAAVFDILADDFDNNGLVDLALTTHTGSFTQIFYQREPRNYIAGGRIENVGFHPGDLLRLRSGGPSTPLYLMNSEGENAIRIFRASDNLGLEQVAEVGAPAPRVATEFSWPDRGRGLAFGPFARNTIFVITGFRPLEGARGPAYELPLPSSLSRIHQIAAADLDKDGSDEILFVDATKSSLHAVSAPDEDDLPTIHTLWRFDEGGRHRLVLPADINQDGRLELLVPEEIAPKERDGSPRVTVFDVNTDNRLVPMTLSFDSREDDDNTDPATFARGFNAIDFAVDKTGEGLLLLTSENEVILALVPEGWDGEALATRRISFGARSGVRKALLRDLDGDGWLDAVIGLTTARGSNVIIYGPLWEGAARLRDSGQSLEQLP